MLAPKIRQALSRFGVGTALCLGVFGQVITFYPGASAWWYGAAAAFAAAGLLSLNWPLRLVGAGLVVVFVWFAWLGYQQGQRYQEWLREEMPRIREHLRQ